MHPHNIRVRCLAEHCELHVDHVLLAGAQSFVDDLDGKLSASVALGGELDHCEVTSAKLLAEFVLLFDVRLPVC